MIDLYEVHLKPYLGPMFMTCSDGASVYRVAQHDLFTCTTPQDPLLNAEVCSLAGFNIFCGRYDIVLGPDGKHIVKSKFFLCYFYQPVLITSRISKRSSLPRRLNGAQGRRDSDDTETMAVKAILALSKSC